MCTSMASLPEREREAGDWSADSSVPWCLWLQSKLLLLVYAGARSGSVRFRICEKFGGIRRNSIATCSWIWLQRTCLLSLPLCIYNYHFCCLVVARLGRCEQLQAVVKHTGQRYDSSIHTADNTQRWRLDTVLSSIYNSCQSWLVSQTRTTTRSFISRIENTEKVRFVNLSPLDQWLVSGRRVSQQLVNRLIVPLQPVVPAECHC